MNYTKLALTGTVLGLLSIFVLLPISLILTGVITAFLPLDLLGGFASLVVLLIEGLFLGILVILVLGVMIQAEFFGMNSFQIPKWHFVSLMKSLSMQWTP